MNKCTALKLHGYTALAVIQIQFIVVAAINVVITNLSAMFRSDNAKASILLKTCPQSLKVLFLCIHSNLEYIPKRDS